MQHMRERIDDEQTPFPHASWSPQKNEEIDAMESGVMLHLSLQLQAKLQEKPSLERWPESVVGCRFAQRGWVGS